MPAFGKSVVTEKQIILWFTQTSVIEGNSTLKKKKKMHYAYNYLDEKPIQSQPVFT